ncbi:MAG: bifunctional oligoribonuclease/PAP phosphatase NrnA [Gudongella sp.]|jgi:phosphoesterase RecJ-like protein|nr:bifunctional oligoribonuclease/PAP phosphatase NrnA [Gudongella sp.]
MNSELLKIKDLIDESKNISIVSHVNPDGDNMGSVLALGISLTKIKGTVDMVMSDSIPEDYRFLPGVDLLKGYGEPRENIDILFVLDCSDLMRLGENQKLAETAKVIVNIDHHVSNEMFGDINIVDPQSSSTGEMIFSFLESLELPIDREIATCIYTAISTDTGRFTYQNVTGKTHIIISKLYDYGINGYEINKNLYQNRSLKRTQLFIKILSGIELMFDGKFALASVSIDMLNETGASMEDTEGVVEFLRDTASVEAACLLKEISKDEIKVSLRTKETVDANAVCNVFGGGGHIRASGCTINGNLMDAGKMMTEEIEKLLLNDR